MTLSRLTICAATFVLLPAIRAMAEPAVTKSAVNLRAGVGTGHELVGKIPGGSVVEVSHCNDWCEVQWQGKKGFAIASSLERGKHAATRRTTKRPDLFAVDPASNKSVLDTPRSSYEAPERYYGPVFWTYGPSNGLYKGTSGIGYRGRW
jgi:uncharacterized protein YraI